MGGLNALEGLEKEGIRLRSRMSTLQPFKEAC